MIHYDIILIISRNKSACARGSQKGKMYFGEVEIYERGERKLLESGDNEKFSFRIKLTNAEINILDEKRASLGASSTWFYIEELIPRLKEELRRRLIKHKYYKPA